jgi:hypothetical protein
MIMNFWNLSDGSFVENTTEFKDSGGELFPDNTKVLAAIEEAKWDEYEGDRTISLKWRVIGEQFKNRVQFQNLKVYGTKKCKDKLKSSDRAKRMLAAINTNAGSKLPMDREPTDQDLMSALMGKPMGILIKLATLEDKKQVNYVAGISSSKQQPAQQAAPVQQRPVQQAAPSAVDFDDDIPF